MSFPLPEIEMVSAFATLTGDDVVTFDKDTDPRITAGGLTFQSGSFKRFPKGTRLKVTFRFKKGETTKRLADLEPISNEQYKPATKPVVKGTTGGYYIPDEVSNLMAIGSMIAETKGMFNVMVLGGSGYGKTTVMSEIAKALNMTFLRVDCPLVRDPNDWYGSLELRDGKVGTETQFVFNQLTATLEAGNAIILLDEINRLETWISNGLFRLLDSGTLVVRDREIKLGGKIIFAATANIGYQYTGTFALDEALQNRFMATLTVSAMPQAAEISVLTERTGINGVNAERIVKVVNVLRGKQFGVDVSHRASLAIAELVAAGLDVNKAFQYVVGNRCSDIDKKSLNDALRML